MLYSDSLDKLKISLNSPIRDVMKVIDNGGSQIALAVDSENRFLGIVTDGDIRRGLLNNLSLEASINSLVNVDAIVATTTTPFSQIKALMDQYKIRHIPVLDVNRKLIGVHLWDELNQAIRRNTFVIMAGGLGTRLMPKTADCPKPMLYVRGKPIIEHIILKAKEKGFKNFLISVNYLSHVIKEYLRDGSAFGVIIEYLDERERLGTVGALSLWNEPVDAPFIVTNGDILTDLDYASLLDFHLLQDSMATMAVRQHEIQNPYGVVQVHNNFITGFDEKPVYRCYINAGVYALDPSALKFLNKGEYCDMPILFNKISEHNHKKVHAYLDSGDWTDIGSPADFEAVNQPL